jgi:alcohol dehydrogenase (NADP+)
MVQPAANYAQIRLNDGKDMPQIGLGTFLAPPAEIKAIVKAAILKHGYRSLDTATLYGNEEAIGEALEEVYAESDIKREDLFLTTKLWVTDRADSEAALKLSLAKLKTEYLDLYLMHYVNVPIDIPNGKIDKIPIEKTWKEFEGFVKAGLVRSIGVSNCPVIMLMNIIAGAEIPPANNQVEMHPYFVRKPFVDFHKKFNVSVTAYAPIGAPGFGARPE